jgi:hypothetical protein
MLTRSCTSIQLGPIQIPEIWDEKREKAKENGLDPEDAKQPDKFTVDSYYLS